jgi:hypothetical protein
MARSRFRNRFLGRWAAIVGSFAKMFGGLIPAARNTGTQRMCPSCGLITPRAQAFCLECGKSLRDSA